MTVEQLIAELNKEHEEIISNKKNSMTTTEIYKQALNDILNSKSDAPALRKIALTAFTQPIKDIAPFQPLNWMQYETQKFEWYLYVNGVHIACLVDDGMEGKEWVLFDYDTDFAPVFGNGSMPKFATLEEGKQYCEMKFLLWLKDAAELVLTPKQPQP